MTDTFSIDNLVHCYGFADFSARRSISAPSAPLPFYMQKLDIVGAIGRSYVAMARRGGDLVALA